MKNGGPSLLSRNLWVKRTTRFLTILERALQLLATESDLMCTEVELNRRLYWRLLEATRELYPSENLPLCECNNQPDPDDQTRARRENKRPDFQWSYTDRFEPDPRRSSKQFVVECKRLGSPPRSDWILNINYVEHGVLRFMRPEWGYAKGFSSAAMVGYWQDMIADEILCEVNDAAIKRGICRLSLSREGWRSAGISRLDHECERPFPVSPILVYHLWADLRGISDR